MPYQWWNGSAWVSSETWIPETSTTFSEAFPQGEVQFTIAVEDDTAARSGHSGLRTINVGINSATLAQTLPLLTQSLTGLHTAPGVKTGNITQTLPLLVQSASGTHNAVAVTFDGTITQTLPVLTQRLSDNKLPIPNLTVVGAIEGSFTRVTRRMEIYESDATTLWQPEGSGIDPSIVRGSVTIDASRDERRMLDLTFYNNDDAYKVSENGFWYDKIIKVYRGVDYAGGSWEHLLGEFYPDRIAQSHFPDTITVKARDRTKVMRKSKFSQDTLFSNNDPVEDVIQAIAFAAGIPIGQQDLPQGMGSLYEDTYFNVGDDHWRAAKDIATAFKHDLYFTPDGILEAKLFADPATGRAQYTWDTGETGNLATYDKELTDERLRNHIVITGTNAGQLPIYAEAENTDPSSPTRIDRVGRRTEVYDFSYIGNQFQAQDLADVYLSIASLEQYQLKIEAIVAPYLDAGIIVGFTDPNPAVGDPNEFLLQSLEIPLGLGAMSATAGRVTISG